MKEPIIETIHGATVALYPMKEVEAVTVIARFHAGSWYEGKQWGAHHLLEHVMLDGGEKYRSEEEIELFKEENGLTTNGSTGGDMLEFFVRAPKVRLKDGVSLLFDGLFHPLLEEKSIVLNKTIISQEYKDKWSNPHVRYGRALNENIYGTSHPYVRDGMGDIDFVRTLERKNLQKIYEEFCVTNNLVIVAVGNFTPKTMIEVLTRELEKAPKGERQRYSIPRSKRTLPSFFWSEDVMKVTIDIEWGTKVFTEVSPMSDRLAINIGKYILGGSARSRLFKELRTKRGWVYGASASRGFLPTESWLSVNTSTDAEKAQEVYEILISETEKMVTSGIPDDEFDRAVNYLNMQTLIGFDSVGSIAGKLMGDLFFEERIYMPHELNRIVNAIKKEDITRLLSSFLINKPVVSVMAKTDPKLVIT